MFGESSSQRSGSVEVGWCLLVFCGLLAESARWFRDGVHCCLLAEHSMMPASMPSLASCSSSRCNLLGAMPDHSTRHLLLALEHWHTHRSRLVLSKQCC